MTHILQIAAVAGCVIAAGVMMFVLVLAVALGKAAKLGDQMEGRE